MKKQSNNDPSRDKYQKMLVGKLFVLRNEQYINVPVAGYNGAQLFIGFSLITFDAINKYRSRYYTEQRVLMPVKDFEDKELYQYHTHKCSELAKSLQNGTLEVYDENKHTTLGVFTHKRTFNPRTSREEIIPIDVDAIKELYKKWNESYPIKGSVSYTGNTKILVNAIVNGTVAPVNSTITVETDGTVNITPA